MKQPQLILKEHLSSDGMEASSVGRLAEFWLSSFQIWCIIHGQTICMFVCSRVKLTDNCDCFCRSLQDCEPILTSIAAMFSGPGL